MKCPKYKAAYIASGFAQPNVDIECDREECAWWSKASKSCAMEAIPRIIGYLGSELKTINESIIHGGKP